MHQALAVSKDLVNELKRLAVVAIQDDDDYQLAKRQLIDATERAMPPRLGCLRPMRGRYLYR